MLSVTLQLANFLFPKKSKRSSKPAAGKIAPPFELSQEQKDEIREAFDLFDTDGSGSLEKEEFQLVLANFLGPKIGNMLSEDRINTYWRDMDSDGDGEVAYEGYVILRVHLRERLCACQSERGGCGERG